jgi:hypothetical protein
MGVNSPSQKVTPPKIGIPGMPIIFTPPKIGNSLNPLGEPNKPYGAPTDGQLPITKPGEVVNPWRPDIHYTRDQPAEPIPFLQPANPKLGITNNTGERPPELATIAATQPTASATPETLPSPDDGFAMPDPSKHDIGSFQAAMARVQANWLNKIQNSAKASQQRHQDQNLAQNYARFANTAAGGANKTDAMGNETFDPQTFDTILKTIVGGAKGFGIPGYQTVNMGVQRQGQKVLDDATTRQFLFEAGGDKNKARQIAMSRGYSVA